MMATNRLVGTSLLQSSTSKPLPICSAPSPSEAADPKSVAKMAMMSMTLPQAPWACLAPMSGSKTALMVCLRSRRNVLYAMARPTTA